MDQYFNQTIYYSLLISDDLIKYTYNFKSSDNKINLYRERMLNLLQDEELKFIYNELYDSSIFGNATVHINLTLYDKDGKELMCQDEVYGVNDNKFLIKNYVLLTETKDKRHPVTVYGIKIKILDVIKGNSSPNIADIDKLMKYN